MNTASLYTIYILRCNDGTLYTGITNDLNKRLLEHNTSPKGAKYTYSRRPVGLVYQEPSSGRSAALKREIVIKKMSRIQKKILIAQSAPIL